MNKKVVSHQTVENFRFSTTSKTQEEILTKDYLSEETAINIAAWATYLQSKNIPREDWSWLIFQLITKSDPDDVTFGISIANATDLDDANHLHKYYEEACCAKAIWYDTSPLGGGYYFFTNGGH